MSQAEFAHEGHSHVVVTGGRFNEFMFRFWARSPRLAAPLAVLVCFAGGVAFVESGHTIGSDAFTSPTCLIKLSTGFDCPGCGGTRAFWFLLRGDLPAAARSHIMAVFAAPFLVYLYVAWAANVVFKRKLPQLHISPKAVSIFLAAWGVFTLLR